MRVPSGSIALPHPILAEPDPKLWGARVVLMNSFIWAEATTIYVAIEAAKAVAGAEKPKAPPVLPAQQLSLFPCKCERPSPDIWR